MARFSYSALTGSGDRIKGDTQANNESAVVDWLLGQGYTPVEVQALKTGESSPLSNLFSQREISSTELTAITRDLSSLIDSGLTIERSLRIIGSNSERKGVRTAIDRMLDSLQNGASFARAMERSSSAFPRYYTSLVSAGEASGTLGEVLDRLSGHLKKSEEVRSRITSALIYPIFLLLMIVVTMFLVVGFVLPQFQEVFENAGDQLPFATRFVMGLGTFFEQWGWLVLVGLAIMLAAIARALTFEPTRRSIDRFILGRNVFLGLARKSETAVFARTVGMLVQNGLSLPEALHRSTEAADNLAIKSALSEMRLQLREGGRFVTAIRGAEVFPDLLVQLAAVGEETGRLDVMLLQAAEIYEREVESTIERLLTLLVPVLTVFMGVVVGGLIVSVLMGIMSINQLAL